LFLDLLAELELVMLQDFLAQRQTELVDFQAMEEFVLALAALVVLELLYLELVEYRLEVREVVLLTKQEY
jgi:Leu/Phe-tRNA-protein transferase